MVDYPIETWFSYRTPKGGQIVQYMKMCDKAKELAYLIIECCPDGADKTVAIRKLREVLMNANAAIACRGNE